HRKYAADGADAAPHGPAHLPRATAARPGRATRDRSGGTPALRGTAVPPREPDPDGAVPALAERRPWARSRFAGPHAPGPGEGAGQRCRPRPLRVRARRD